MKKLIIGLGNPGDKYYKTRHNIAWQAIESLSFYSQLSWKEKFMGCYSQYSFKESTYYILKPNTYMNLSGKSVYKLKNFYNINVENILVIQDDVDFPFGVLSFKKGGGLAGHNGLRSISECLGSDDYLRLRLGIGKPEKGSLSSWVLSRFSPDELKNYEKYLSLAARAIEEFIEKDLDFVANKYNKKNLLEE